MLKLTLMLLSAALALSPIHTVAAPLVIRTAAQDSPPKFLKDGNNINGLCIDVFRAIERLDPSLSFPILHEFVPLPRIEHQLSVGNYDLFCGLAKTPKREASLDFIEPPVYLTHATLAVRADDDIEIKSFDDLRKLGDKGVVLVVAKTVHAETLKAEAGIRFHDTSLSLGQTLQLLLNGRGRLLFHSDLALAEQIRLDRLGDKIKVLPTRLQVEGRYIVFSKKAPPALREKVSAALEQLSKSGELAKLFQRYQPK